MSQQIARRLTVGLCIGTLYKGGAERQMLMLARLLRARYNVVCFVFHGHLVDDDFKRYIEEHNLDVVLLTGSFAAKTCKLFRAMHKHHVDVMFGYLALCNTLGALCARLAGVKRVILGIRSSKFIKKKLVVQRLVNNTIAHGVVCNSRRGLEAIKAARFHSREMCVIYNGIVAPDAPAPHPQPDVLTIVTVARFNIAKDFPTALSVIQKLKDYPQTLAFRYQIVGYGELEEDVRRQVRKMGLDDIVEMVINPPNVPDYLCGADIYLSTSTFEGLSNSIMEGAAHALPIVATDVGDTSSIVLDGTTGALASPGDVEAIAAALQKLMASQELRRTWGEAGWRHVRDTFSEEALLRNYTEFIDRLFS